MGIIKKIVFTSASSIKCGKQCLLQHFGVRIKELSKESISKCKIPKLGNISSSCSSPRPCCRHPLGIPWQDSVHSLASRVAGRQA